VDAVNAGTLDEAILNRSVERLLRINERAQATTKGGNDLAIDAHHALARKIAAEGLVLLKNDNDLLPLTGTETLAVIGQGALVPAYQGGGSSHINATRVDQPLELLRQEAEINFIIGDGHSLEVDSVQIAEAVQVAQSADVALLFIALPSQIESEGYDRRDLNLTPQQVALIQAVAAVQPRTVVVLNNGSAINMFPWIDAVPAVLEAWLPGQAGAGAIMDVLFGRVNPSGKLTETFPLALSDTPAYLNFPGDNGQVRYGEGIFIGYRGYEATNRPVLFPFGYGLSYTKFAYSNLRVSQTDFTVDDTLEVSLDLTNTGQRAGKEVVQLYIHDAASRLRRPVKELKGFAKVALEAGETKTVRLTLNSRAFSYYDPAYSRWLAEAGEFEILIGSSSAHIHLHQTITMTAGTPLPSRLNPESTLGDWLDDPKGTAMVEPLFQLMVGSTEASGGDKSLGIDMLTFFRDLPLQVMFSFQGAGLHVDPNELVADMLAQVRAE
ncbi:MAG: glycoside hydrolase family 3 C-terminal domain-containing protein, partial [Anaerolineae bacterium]|nr:glycoside hydrolase family 3 C-terminal domain-containing protein [Anaerolineae bacterium]